MVNVFRDRIQIGTYVLTRLWTLLRIALTFLVMSSVLGYATGEILFRVNLANVCVMRDCE